MENKLFDEEFYIVIDQLKTIMEKYPNSSHKLKRTYLKSIHMLINDNNKEKFRVNVYKFILFLIENIMNRNNIDENRKNLDDLKIVIKNIKKSTTQSINYLKEVKKSILKPQAKEEIDYIKIHTLLYLIVLFIEDRKEYSKLNNDINPFQNEKNINHTLSLYKKNTQ